MFIHRFQPHLVLPGAVHKVNNFVFKYLGNGNIIPFDEEFLGELELKMLDHETKRQYFRHTVMWVNGEWKHNYIPTDMMWAPHLERGIMYGRFLGVDHCVDERFMVLDEKRLLYSNNGRDVRVYNREANTLTCHVKDWDPSKPSEVSIMGFKVAVEYVKSWTLDDFESWMTLRPIAMLVIDTMLVVVHPTRVYIYDPDRRKMWGVKIPELGRIPFIEPYEVDDSPVNGIKAWSLTPNVRAKYQLELTFDLQWRLSLPDIPPRMIFWVNGRRVEFLT